jgi:hypothetical protein
MECRESLPVYEKPRKIYKLDLSTSFFRPDDIRLNLAQVILGHNKIYFELDLVNLFDETLSDSSEEKLGEITLWWDKDPAVQVHIPVMNTDEINSHIFYFTPEVTLDPGDSVRFAVWWQYCLDDEGQYMWTHADRVWQSEDGSYKYTNYGPMDFTLQAQIRPLANGPAVYSNLYKVRITFYLDEDK